jgi:hypothetical protein
VNDCERKDVYDKEWNSYKNDTDSNEVALVYGEWCMPKYGQESNDREIPNHNYKCKVVHCNIQIVQQNTENWVKKWMKTIWKTLDDWKISRDKRTKKKPFGNGIDLYVYLFGEIIATFCVLRVTLEWIISQNRKKREREKKKREKEKERKKEERNCTCENTNPSHESHINKWIHLRLIGMIDGNKWIIFERSFDIPIQRA